MDNEPHKVTWTDNHSVARMVSHTMSHGQITTEHRTDSARHTVLHGLITMQCCMDVKPHSVACTALMSDSAPYSVSWTDNDSITRTVSHSAMDR